MVELTPTAAGKVASYLKKRGSGVGIRIGVKTTGCSGLAYLLEYVDQPDPTDLVVETGGCKVCISPAALPYLSGLVVDWAVEGLNQGFKFNNPNEVGRCGCGESFRV